MEHWVKCIVPLKKNRGVLQWEWQRLCFTLLHKHFQWCQTQIPLSLRVKSVSTCSQHDLCRWLHRLYWSNFLLNLAENQVEVCWLWNASENQEEQKVAFKCLRANKAQDRTRYFINLLLGCRSRNLRSFNKKSCWLFV